MCAPLSWPATRWTEPSSREYIKLCVLREEQNDLPGRVGDSEINHRQYVTWYPPPSLSGLLYAQFYHPPHSDFDKLPRGISISFFWIRKHHLSSSWSRKKWYECMIAINCIISPSKRRFPPPFFFFFFLFANGNWGSATRRNVYCSAILMLHAIRFLCCTAHLVRQCNWRWSIHTGSPWENKISSNLYSVKWFFTHKILQVNAHLHNKNQSIPQRKHITWRMSID